MDQQRFETQAKHYGKWVSQCAQNLSKGNKWEISVSPFPHPFQKFSRAGYPKFKVHFISRISSTHKDFSLHTWCQLLQHASLKLNLLRKLCMNPKLSGYAQLHGEIKYNPNPLSPPGTKLIVHEKPKVRRTWASHGVKWWYLGPSMEHYICHCVYVTKTRGESDSYCVDFFPHNTPLP